MPKRSSFIPLNKWQGEHQSYTQKIEGYHKFSVFHPENTTSAKWDAYNQITKEFQELIAEAVQNNKTLRAMGSSWSLSKVGVAEDHLINTKALRIVFELPGSQVSSNYAGDSSKLRFLECGASMAAINKYLYKKGLSLKTSGSNDGQTLAGAISTGTHGSTFKFGSCQEFVVGLHLITGPNKHVYLERASYPVVSPAFVKKFGAEFKSDDDLFNAALVSFGSFGIIHGVMIETRSLFTLNAHRNVMPFNAGLRKAIKSLKFSDITLPKPVSKLRHFEVIFNPNEGTPPKEAIVKVMFKGKWTSDYQAPEWHDGSSGPGVGVLEIVGDLIGRIPEPLSSSVKPALNEQVRDEFAPFPKEGRTAVIRDMFRGEKVRAKNLSCGIGVSLGQANNALSVAFKSYKNFGAILPLIISVRFVKGTQALLGFTKFEKTCVLEIDAVSTTKTREYLNLVWKDLDAAGIPFTLHWGKFNSYLSKSRVIKMYGDSVDKWLASRTELMENEQVKRVFNNGFLKKVGLDL